MIFKSDQRLYSEYALRCDNRQKTIFMSSMESVVYFMGLGDDKPTAENKVSQLSTEVAPLLYAYVLGNEQPLRDAINASTLPFMDAAAKAAIVGYLTPAT
jgi:hypothetical protein